MGALRQALLFLAVGVMLALSAADASAQMFNQPFQFKSRSGNSGEGGSVGMSMAHRQLILERELLGRPADNPVIRDATGALLEVERANSGQAFVRGQASAYYPGMSGRSGTALGVSGVGLAYGLGFSGNDSSMGVFDTFHATPVADVMAAWIAAIDSRGQPLAGAYHPTGGGSMDAWIGQLYLL